MQVGERKLGGGARNQPFKAMVNCFCFMLRTLLSHGDDYNKKKANVINMCSKITLWLCREQILRERNKARGTG